MKVNESYIVVCVSLLSFKGMVHFSRGTLHPQYRHGDRQGEPSLHSPGLLRRQKSGCLSWFVVLHFMKIVMMWKLNLQLKSLQSSSIGLCDKVCECQDSVKWYLLPAENVSWRNKNKDKETRLFLRLVVVFTLVFPELLATHVQLCVLLMNDLYPELLS